LERLQLEVRPVKKFVGSPKQTMKVGCVNSLLSSQLQGKLNKEIKKVNMVEVLAIQE
jgi:hypothetical protein